MEFLRISSKHRNASLISICTDMLHHDGWGGGRCRKKASSLTVHHRHQEQQPPPPPPPPLQQRPRSKKRHHHPVNLLPAYEQVAASAIERNNDDIHARDSMGYRRLLNGVMWRKKQCDPHFGRYDTRMKTAVTPSRLGGEPLPPYTCTVYKMGYVRIKQEAGIRGQKVKQRPWSKRYLMLWGTVLHVFETKAKCNDRAEPLRSVSMQRVDAGMATEFKRRPGVLRLCVPNGEQFLLQADDLKDMVSWIEHLQAAANISVDLDHRRMPRFVTMVRPNGNNDRSHTFNLDLGNQQRTVVRICRSRC